MKNESNLDYFVENREHVLEDLGLVLRISLIVWSYFCDLEECQNISLQRLTWNIAYIEKEEEYYLLSGFCGKLQRDIN